MTKINRLNLKNIRDDNDWFWKHKEHLLFGKEQRKIKPTTPKYILAGKDVYVEDMTDKQVRQEFSKLICPTPKDIEMTAAVIDFCTTNKIKKWEVHYSGSGDSGGIDTLDIAEKHKELKMNNRKQNILLNPGPVNMSDRVKRRMTEEDFCHREIEFSDLIIILMNYCNNLIYVLLERGPQV